MTTAHTPGPWPLAHVRSAIRHIQKNVDHDSYCFDAGEDKCHFHWDYSSNDPDLIAAAPDLKMWLYELVRECELKGLDVSPKLLSCAKAAIARAEGGGQ